MNLFKRCCQQRLSNPRLYLLGTLKGGRGQSVCLLHVRNQKIKTVWNMLNNLEKFFMHRSLGCHHRDGLIITRALSPSSYKLTPITTTSTASQVVQDPLTKTPFWRHAVVL